MFTWTIQGILILICFSKYWFKCVKRIKRETQHQSILCFCPSYISSTITLQHFCFNLAFYITCLFGIVFGWCWNDACTKTIKHHTPNCILSNMSRNSSLYFYHELKFGFFNSDTTIFWEITGKNKLEPCWVSSKQRLMY